jgi:hypothetical protein
MVVTVRSKPHFLPKGKWWGFFILPKMVRDFAENVLGILIPVQDNAFL